MLYALTAIKCSTLINARWRIMTGMRKKLDVEVIFLIRPELHSALEPFNSLRLIWTTPKFKGIASKPSAVDKLTRTTLEADVGSRRSKTMKFVKGSKHKVATEDGGDSQDEMNTHNWNYNYFFLRQSAVLPFPFSTLCSADFYLTCNRFKYCQPYAKRITYLRTWSNTRSIKPRQQQQQQNGNYSSIRR